MKGEKSSEKNGAITVIKYTHRRETKNEDQLILYSIPIDSLEKNHRPKQKN